VGFEKEGGVFSGVRGEHAHCFGVRAESLEHVGHAVNERKFFDVIFEHLATFVEEARDFEAGDADVLDEFLEGEVAEFWEFGGSDLAVVVLGGELVVDVDRGFKGVGNGAVEIENVGGV